MPVKSLEDRIRPPLALHPGPRDALALGLLAAMAVILLSSLDVGWTARGAAPPGVSDPDAAQPAGAADEVLFRITQPMASVYLLPALGCMLAIRRGAVDLSVWLSMGLGGLVAAWLIGPVTGGQPGPAPGAPTAVALLAGVLAGAAVGGVNAALVAGLRWPSPVATFAVALVGVGALCLAPADEAVRVPTHAFVGWIVDDLPLFVSRMLLVAVIYAVVMLILLGADARERARGRLDRRFALAVALIASGALAAAGGALWLIEHGSAPVPRRPIGDLRIPAAALLAGAAVLGGRGRTMLTGAALPLALLVVGVWRLGVSHLPAGGYELQVAALAVMLVGTAVAMRRAAKGLRFPQPLAVPAVVLTAGGVLVLATMVHVESPHARAVLAGVGAGFWTAGAILLGVSCLLTFRRRRRLASPSGTPRERAGATEGSQDG